MLSKYFSFIFVDLMQDEIELSPSPENLGIPRPPRSYFKSQSFLCIMRFWFFRLFYESWEAAESGARNMEMESVTLPLVQILALLITN